MRPPIPTITPPPTSPIPDIVRAVRALFYLLAAIWLVLAFFTLLHLEGGLLAGSLTYVLITILMFGNVLAYLVGGWGIARSSRWFYFFGLAVVTGNLLLSFTDQVGLMDILTGVLNLVTLVLLVWKRRVFIG